MFKVLLADDEKVICEGLKALIDWGALGFEICGVAKNGLEVVALYEKLLPDLVITDIKMPKLSGLEAIAQIKERGFEPEFMLLTGYAEFEYARSALEQGSSGYMVKPVDDQELIEKLKKAAQKLEDSEEEQNKREAEYLWNVCSKRDETFEEVPKLILPDILYTIILIEPVVQIENLEVSTFEALNAALTVNFNEFTANYKTDPLYGEIIAMKKYGFDFKNRIMPVKTGYLAFICADAEDIYPFFKSLSDKYTDVRFLISETAQSLYSIYDSYLSLDDCRRQYFYAQKKRRIIAGQSAAALDSDKFEPLDVESIVTNLTLGKIDEAQNALVHAKEQMAEKRYALPIIEAYINLFTTRLMLFMDEAFYLGQEIYQTGDRLKTLLRQIDLLDLISALMKILLLTNDLLQNSAKNADMGIIKDVTVYLKERFTEKITLKTVAERFFINAAYLGQLFKRKTGVSFHDYLLKLRMEKAKQLLVATNKSISEISNEVGFDDPNYFSASFGKIEGITPREYKKRISEGATAE